MKLLALSLFLSLSPAAISQAPAPAEAQPAKEAVQVQAASWTGTWWRFDGLKPVNVITAGPKDSSFTEAFGNKAMYVISIPKGFDGSITVESDPKYEFKIEAWDEQPSLQAITQGVLGHVSMGNTISFKNSHNHALIYLSITSLRTPPLANLSITVRIHNSK